MNPEVIDVIECGDVTLKTVKLGDSDVRYWLQVSFGALEFRDKDIKDLQLIMKKFSTPWWLKWMR